jgi:hypothetical protein
MIQWTVFSHDSYRELERRFDGEMPEGLRRIALAGGRTRFEIALAQSNSRCCDRLALSAGRRLASHRSPVCDLGAWRRAGLAWRLAAEAAAKL